MKNKSIPAKLLPSYEAFKKANEVSRAWDSLVSESIKTYGARPQGGHVSGIYSEHFPQALQDRLRDMARQVSELSDKAYSLKPARVHASTIRALRGLVVAQYGKAYYG
jgi:hypothetical protein